MAAMPRAARRPSPKSKPPAARPSFSPPTSLRWPKFAASLRPCAQEPSRLDILINNAGIGTAGAKRQVSADGYELRFAVNYLAGFLLTSELLPLLKASAPSRIVNVASAGQQAIDFGDVMLTRSYDGVRAYCQSKLAQILFTIDLAGELKGTGVTVNALHPASYMNTTMVRQAGVTPWSSVETGADAILNLATSPALEGRSGLYFDGLKESRADAQAYDAKARQQLRTSEPRPRRPGFARIEGTAFMSKTIEHTVIIGGSSGIGLATARKLLGPGMKVTITGRNQDKLNSAWKSLGGAAEKAAFDASEAGRGPPIL